MRIASIAALLCLALAASAADRKETRTVGSFNAIGLSAPIKVIFTQGDTESVVVEGDDAALVELETVVENGVLKLRKKTREHVRLMDKVKAYVTAREVRTLAISGSGDIETHSLRTGDVKLAISGSGDIRIGQLTASKVDASIGGSGDIDVAGMADSISVSIAGSGDLRASSLEVKDAKVSVAGSGDAKVWTRASLSASIVGSGDVQYYGDPTVKTSIIGSGSVRRMGRSPS